MTNELVKHLNKILSSGSLQSLSPIEKAIHAASRSKSEEMTIECQFQVALLHICKTALKSKHNKMVMLLQYLEPARTFGRFNA